MPDRLSSMLDFYWTHQGDISLGENGDIKDTREDQYRALIQVVVDRLQSEENDWFLYPEKGAGLNAVVGQRNTAEAGREVQRRIQSTLLYGGLLKPTEFSVNVVPISETQIMAVVSLNPPGSTEAILIPFSYDMRSNRVTPRIV